jgi:methyl coenzyme M reductase subunit C
MALEAIHPDTRKHMAPLAKILVAAEHAVVLAAGVAINAASQAVLRASRPEAHGVVALMPQDIHVVLAHELRVFHALPTLADVEPGADGIPRPDRHHGKQQDE